MRLFRGKLRRLSFWRRKKAGISYRGDFACWEDAVKESTGYDSRVILERTRDALLKVKSGEAVFERDSVILDKPEYPFAVLAALLRAGSLDGGRLSVVDFGGSLGSTYFSCRRWLAGMKELEWSVVEQPAHVACGRQHFEDDTLRFYETIDACLEHRRPGVLLLSSVLQYLPEPYEMLDRLLGHRLRHLVLDRTAFVKSDRDRLTVQTVPETIYPATYPAWFFSETRMAAMIAAAGYDFVADFPGLDRFPLANDRAYFKGFILEQRGLE